MNWVKEFYSAQNEWFGVYLGKVEEAHYERASLVSELVALTENQRILELGGGGGQTAIALASLGYDLTMIELLENSCHHASNLAKEEAVDLKVVQGDFYEIELSQKFDLVCYFDSFGIGTDEDQHRLLRRINNWMAPRACAIIEVGATWYWSGIAKGKSMDLGDCMRLYDFDASNARLIDKWWKKESPQEAVFQSLRCYTPADLNLLLEGTGLKITAIEPGGKVDYDKMKFIKKTVLGEAMTYYVRLEKCTS